MFERDIGEHEANPLLQITFVSFSIFNNTYQNCSIKNIYEEKLLRKISITIPFDYQEFKNYEITAFRFHIYTYTFHLSLSENSFLLSIYFHLADEINWIGLKL